MSFKKLPYKQCDLCKDKKGPNPGFYYVDIDVGGRQYKGVMECECHIKWTTDNRILIGAAKNNLWNDPGFWNYDPATSYTGTVSKDIIINKLQPFIDYVAPERSFYFYGRSATQKTTIAQWVGISFLKREKSAYYESLQGLITNLVPATFEDSARAKIYSDKCLYVDVLIIDNAFEKGKCSIQAWQQPYMESFFRDRMEIKKKSVILISSTSPNEIEKNGFSSSLQDFVKRHTEVIDFFDVAYKIDNIGDIVK